LWRAYAVALHIQGPASRSNALDQRTASTLRNAIGVLLAVARASNSARETSEPPSPGESIHDVVSTVFSRASEPMRQSWRSVPLWRS
jgi:hypothetical protein